ncbi:MAG: ACP phosphodiesterase [Lishizhenia sp.]
MNFLGHLYFSADKHDLMTANIFGDFVRGKDLSRFPKTIQEGIILHRKIDNYIDTHEEVLNLMRSLYDELPKVSGIAVDLFFDHLLAKNWEHFHNQPLANYLAEYYTTFDTLPEDYPLEFLIMLGRMRSKNWLWHYRTKAGLEKACNGVGSRIAFKNVLHEAPAIYEKYETNIARVFHTFMHDAQIKFNMVS